MKLTKIIPYLISISFVFSATAVVFADEPIKIQTLTTQPVLDGSATDWSSTPPTIIPLTGRLGIGQVEVRGGTYGDEVFFLLQWPDDTEDKHHKPFIWNKDLEKYVSGDQQEDRLSINFAMEGDFTEQWLSGKSFKADMWHWKAARTNPLGLAHDKMTIISSIKPEGKAYEGKTATGQTVYILRPDDDGTELYTTTRYPEKLEELMPKYVMTKNPVGSITDVKAMGAWKDGRWTLELKRKMNTGNADDVVFVKGEQIQAALALFNQSGDDLHDISKTILLQF